MNSSKKRIIIQLIIVAVLAVTFAFMHRAQTMPQSSETRAEQSQKQQAEKEQNPQEDNEQGTAVAEDENHALREGGKPDITAEVEKDGQYTDKEHVATYIHEYGHLPSNFITKKEAERAGWDSKAGNLQEIAPGMSIGGSHFGNYDGDLPDKEGRSYKECDIDYDGGHRGAKRIIYSNDGLIFYTSDHYKNFEQLY